MSQTLRRVAATTVAALLAMVAMLSVASAAQADTFKGKTEQGKNATLQVRNNDGVPTKFVIRWNSSSCANGSTYKDKTTFNGFKNADANSLSSRGSYTTRQSGGIRSRVRVNVNASRQGQKRWKGTFTARVRVKKGGEQIDRCKLRGNSFTVKRTSGRSAASPAMADRGYQG
ncbi:hypothetical protein HJD18_15865 [Thermoleophilia bacterium SCSIO 60948]|nr:hypothetical protein HJD18_15865 [Thermoleophilia bacterium SCSIO 60948]